MSVEPFWFSVNDASLRQGDYLPHCLVPVFSSDLTTPGTQEVVADDYDLILLTQSCDLEQQKVRLVAACPIYPIAEFEAANPAFARTGRWSEILKGRVEGLHLLAAPTDPANNRETLVIDFREVYSLPFDYFAARAEQLGPRWRLRSPYLEHFSQAFARFFMRVGLPSTIPPFP
jgi:hypothetical protein